MLLRELQNVKSDILVDQKSWSYNLDLWIFRKEVGAGVRGLDSPLVDQWSKSDGQRGRAPPALLAHHQGPSGRRLQEV